MQTYIEIILPLPLNRLFTYSVPSDMVGELAIGKRAVVPFGAKKFYTSIISNIHTTQPQGYKTKDILSLLDEKPVVTKMQLKFWRWISSYYQCSIGDVYKAAVPSGFKIKSETKIIFKNSLHQYKPSNETEKNIIDVILQNQIVTINELTSKIRGKNILMVIKTLLDKNIIEIKEELKTNYSPLKKRYIRFNSTITSKKEVGIILETIKKAPKQYKILNNYIFLSKAFTGNEQKSISVKQLLEKSGANTSTLNALTKKNVFEIYEKVVDRLNLTSSEVKNINLLTSVQKRAYEQIQISFKEKNTVLLHGVTSSGKTEIFTHLIQQEIAKGNQVLYLLPEIALTTQIISRLKHFFGNKIGVYHSKFNSAERVEIWNNILNNNKSTSYSIVMGTRSSLFLPFKKLGLIIIDEEHENTYKQTDCAPRYNGRDAAIVLAQEHNAKVLLATATPSMESYYNAQTGKYGCVSLTERFKGIEMPEIIPADLSEARRKKQMKSLFTPLLYQEIKQALDQKEQIILFQNRRGFSPYLECKSCIHIPKCIYCDVSLTYHKHMDNLICHYCGYVDNNTQKCNECNAYKLITRGFGTEKVEEEIKTLFPQAKIVRMDTDTTRAKNAFENMVYDFEKGNTDILIGTQMIAKGLDFDNVSTVGILNADNMLNYPDFRAYERTFQLLAQVSGRAGRKNKKGKVIIQTSHPQHRVLKYVIENDYLQMFKDQFKERELFKYPPSYKLINVVLKHKESSLLNEASDNLGKCLRNILKKNVLGPEYPPINRIQNWFIKKIMIKISPKESLAKTKWIINYEITKIMRIKLYSQLKVFMDIDPI